MRLAVAQPIARLRSAKLRQRTKPARQDVAAALDGIEERNAVDRRRYRAMLMLRLDRLLRTWWAASIGCLCQPPCNW